jgi:hypothetical protein
MPALTPESLAKADTEHAQQCALFCWAALPDVQALYPELKLMFAIPNGGERNRIVAAQLKAEGVKAGVLDIFLPVPRLTYVTRWYHGMFIEMKIKSNKPTKEQNAFAEAAQAQGYYCVLAYSWEHARDEIIHYLKSGA